MVPCMLLAFSDPIVYLKSLPMRRRNGSQVWRFHISHDVHISDDVRITQHVPQVQQPLPHDNVPHDHVPNDNVPDADTWSIRQACHLLSQCVLTLWSLSVQLSLFRRRMLCAVMDTPK